MTRAPRAPRATVPLTPSLPLCVCLTDTGLLSTSRRKAQSYVETPARPPFSLFFLVINKDTHSTGPWGRWETSWGNTQLRRPRHSHLKGSFTSDTNERRSRQGHFASHPTKQGGSPGLPGWPQAAAPPEVRPWGPHRASLPACEAGAAGIRSAPGRHHASPLGSRRSGPQTSAGDSRGHLIALSGRASGAEARGTRRWLPLSAGRRPPSPLPAK